MALLSDAERRELAPATARAEALVREFWACGIPDTLSHGDLHPGNVAYDGREVRLFDWTDGCVTHPFLDGNTSRACSTGTAPARARRSG